MKKFVLAALALGMAVGPVSQALAQPHDHRGPPHQYRHDDRRHDGRHHRHDNGRREWHGQRHQVDRYNPPPRYVERHWRRGERLPPAYRDRRYVVDHRYYHLAPPPRGYEYVRVNNDIVLAAVATGVITSIITGLMYQ